MATFGNTNSYSSGTNLGGSWWAFQYSTTTGGIIVSISFYWYGGAGSCHIGVYTDNGSNYPASLLVETGLFTPSGGAGSKTINVTPTAFPSGKIWLVFMDAPGDSGGFWTYKSGMTVALACYYVSGTYGAMPQNYPSGGTSASYDIGVYATYIVTQSNSQPVSVSSLPTKADTLGAKTQAVTSTSAPTKTSKPSHTQAVTTLTTPTKADTLGAKTQAVTSTSAPTKTPLLSRLQAVSTLFTLSKIPQPLHSQPVVLSSVRVVVFIRSPTQPVSVSSSISKQSSKFLLVVISVYTLGTGIKIVYGYVFTQSVAVSTVLTTITQFQRSPSQGVTVLQSPQKGVSKMAGTQPVSASTYGLREALPSHLQSVSVTQLSLKSASPSRLQLLSVISQLLKNVVTSKIQPITVTELSLSSLTHLLSLLQPMSVLSSCIKSPMPLHSQPISASIFSIKADTVGTLVQTVTSLMTPIKGMTPGTKIQPVTSTLILTKTLEPGRTQVITTTSIPTKTLEPVHSQTISALPSLTRTGKFVRLYAQLISALSIPSKGPIKSASQLVSMSSVLAKGSSKTNAQPISVTVVILSKNVVKQLTQSVAAAVQIPSLVFVPEWGGYVLIIDSSGDDAIGTYIG